MTGSGARTVRMSPSGSVSLSSTGRMVVLPARTPKLSGLAAGALFGLVRSGRTVCWTSSAESLSASSEVCWGGMTSSQLLTSCMFWFTSHTLPEFTSLRTTRSRFTRNTYDGDATGLGHIHGLVIGIIGALTDILVRPRPRRMHTPAQLHRRRRHTLPAKRHRLRRRTIQRLQQQRLRRRHRHRIRRRTRELQLRIPRLRQRQLTPARQEQLPPARIQHHRPVPHHRQLQIPGTLQPVPGTRLDESVTAPSASTAVTVTCPDFGSAL